MSKQCEQSSPSFERISHINQSNQPNHSLIQDLSFLPMSDIYSYAINYSTSTHPEHPDCSWQMIVVTMAGMILQFTKLTTSSSTTGTTGTASVTTSSFSNPLYSLERTSSAYKCLSSENSKLFDMLSQQQSLQSQLHSLPSSLQPEWAVRSDGSMECTISGIQIQEGICALQLHISSITGDRLVINQEVIYHDRPVVFTIAYFPSVFSGVCEVFLVCFGKSGGGTYVTKRIELGTLSLIDYGITMAGRNKRGEERDEDILTLPVVEKMNTLSSLSRSDVINLLPTDDKGKSKV